MSEGTGLKFIDEDKLVEILEEISSTLFSIYISIDGNDETTFDPTIKLDKLIGRLKDE